MKQSKVRRTDVYESVIIEWGCVIAHLMSYNVKEQTMHIHTWAIYITKWLYARGCITVSIDMVSLKFQEIFKHISPIPFIDVLVANTVIV